MSTRMKSETAAKIRTSELAKIHLAKKQLGWTEDEYRAAVGSASKGKTTSAGELDYRGRFALLELMKKCGFKVTHARKAPLKNPNDMTIGDDREQVKKIRSLWLELHDFGAVRDSSERALAHYVKRIAGKESPRFLDMDEASNVIETLKKWQTRTRIAPFTALLNLPTTTRASAVIRVVHGHTSIAIDVCTKSEWGKAFELIEQSIKQSIKQTAQTGQTEKIGAHNGR